jgi:hypothetical protein
MPTVHSPQLYRVVFRLLVALPAAWFALSVAPCPAAAPPIWSGVVLKQNPPEDNDQFGTSVGISGSNAIVGAPGVGPVPGGTHPEGEVYFYTLSGGAWQRIAAFTGSDGDLGHGDAVGQAVAIDGDIAVVGAPNYMAASPYDHADGVAYVYRRIAGTWTSDGILTAPGHADLEMYGCSVAISGTTIVVGSCAYDNQAGTITPQRGAAFVYSDSGAGWMQVATLAAPDAAAYDQFGAAVAIDGDTIVVGAPRKQVGDNDQQGATYVFTRNGAAWTFATRLTADDGASDDEFGQSVAISEDTLLVGAPGTSNSDISGGAVYAFHRNDGTWTQSQRFIAADSTNWVVDLGESIALQGHTAVVGAPLGEAANGSAGLAYVFAETGGVWTRTGTMSYPESGSDMPTDVGWSVAVSGPTALVGSLNINGPGVVMIETSSDLIFRDGFQ